MKWLAAALLLVAACGVDPAPKDVDGNVRWLWLHGDEATDAQVYDALATLHAAIGADSMEDRLDSSLEALHEGDTAIVEMSAPGNVGAARGLIQANVVKCGFAETVRLFVEADQKTLHPSYDAYARAFDGDVAGWRAAGTGTLSWTNTYSVSLLGSHYTADIKAIGRLAAARGEGVPKGPFLLVRAWLPKPATFTGSDSDFFRQDYQVQAFWERAPGETVHVFGVWREIRFGGLTLDDSAFVSGTFSNFANGDEEIAEACGK